MCSNCCTLSCLSVSPHWHYFLNYSIVSSIFIFFRLNILNLEFTNIFFFFKNFCNNCIPYTFTSRVTTVCTTTFLPTSRHCTYQFYLFNVPGIFSAHIILQRREVGFMCVTILLFKIPEQRFIEC